MENLSSSSSAPLKTNDAGSGDSSPSLAQFEEILRQYDNVSRIATLSLLIDNCLTKIVVGERTKSNAEELAMLSTILIESLNNPVGSKLRKKAVSRPINLNRIKFDVAVAVNHAGVLLEFAKALSKTGKEEYIHIAAECEETHSSLNNLQNFLREAESGSYQEFLVGYIIDVVSKRIRKQLSDSLKSKS